MKNFESYFDGRALCCQVKGVLSTMKPIYCGVPLGSMLGPPLFNDLPVAVLDINIIMYADDTSIGRSLTSVTEIKQHLIPAFCKVYELMKCNKLIV